MEIPPSSRVEAPRRAMLAAAAALHLVILYAPSTPGGPGLPHLDKLAHVLAFGVLAWAALRARLSARWVIGLLLAHAVLSEVVQQQLLADRTGDPRDVLADAAGTLLGAGLAGRRARWRT